MDLNRRDFVAAAAVTICGCLVGCAGSTNNGPSADATDLPPENNPDATVDVGTPADYPHDGVYDQHALADRIYIVRRGAQLYALRSICTHRACLVQPIQNDFRCPCHGSRFELDGRVTKGPATRSLAHYGIARGDGGRLIVDKSKRFPPEANDPAMSVAVS